ncbi:hypothetical protein H0G86_002916 [Trichoderma simmonsii]|uniref:Uncharacterized protein n=1 Tax=Trichoderma simmonsii TaxID=1491479 RepID=A0A8G0PDX0_9HYPO|nr:hypothetical protein H0G86_002916 [Trichoderma simmonsii]
MVVTRRYVFSQLYGVVWLGWLSPKRCFTVLVVPYHQHLRSRCGDMLFSVVELRIVKAAIGPSLPFSNFLLPPPPLANSGRTRGSPCPSSIAVDDFLAVD